MSDWMLEWCVLPSWRTLHRVHSGGPDERGPPDDPSEPAFGSTLCGKKGMLAVPGVFSRLRMPRCKICCRMAGVPYGGGNPYNGR